MKLYRSIGCLVGIVATLFLAINANAEAAAPVKLVLTSRFGWEVNSVSKANVCTISPDNCQAAKVSGSAGGFRTPVGVATVPVGGGLTGENDIYIADAQNLRVQEFTPTGEFVSMFGNKVNKKGGDFCTAAEVGECQVGESGSTPGAFYPTSLAVDRKNGDIYVVDGNHSRVIKYTPGGQLVWMAGKERSEEHTSEL